MRSTVSLCLRKCQRTLCTRLGHPCAQRTNENLLSTELRCGWPTVAEPLRLPQDGGMGGGENQKGGGGGVPQGGGPPGWGRKPGRPGGRPKGGGGEGWV